MGRLRSRVHLFLWLLLDRFIEPLGFAVRQANRLSSRLHQWSQGDRLFAAIADRAAKLFCSSASGSSLSVHRVRALASLLPQLGFALKLSLVPRLELRFLVGCFYRLLNLVRDIGEGVGVAVGFIQRLPRRIPAAIRGARSR